MKKFFTRLATSKVLLKQLVLAAVGLVWLILRLLKVVDPGQEEAVIAIIVQVFDYIVLIVNLAYSIYSGGNNPTNKTGY